MQLNYDLEMQPAIVGMLADTVFKTTDSYHVEGKDGIVPGMPVVAGTDARQVKFCDDCTKVIGIAMFVHKEVRPKEAYYKKGYVAPIVTNGRVWVAVDGDVTAHTVAKYDIENKVWSADNGVEVPNVKFISAAQGGMAVVEIR